MTELAAYKKAWYEKNKDRILQLRREYYENNKDTVLERQREYYSRTKSARLAYNAEWQKQNPLRYAWSVQKGQAKERGIEFKLTFEEFCDFWGDDFDKRGRGGEALQMCRYNDEGPYSVDNIYKATALENNTAPRVR